MNVPTYQHMLCSLTKGRRKYSCQNCVDNDEISKCTKILNKKEQDNEEKQTIQSILIYKQRSQQEKKKKLKT